MDDAMQSDNAFPLFVCGLPRSGTSFLFAVLSTHPAFANENFKDKELRYFEKLLGNRPWGQVDGVSQRKFDGIDRFIVPDLVRALDARLRALRGGPRGHYINANPRDIFCSRLILEAVPEAKFIVALRDPLTHIWSALNYPSHTWGKREQRGFFREEDVRRTAEHWNKVASFVVRNELVAQPSSYLLLEQERLAGASRELHEQIEAFLGLDGVADLLDENATLIIHSSFVEDPEGRGRDRRFTDRGQKAAHFRDCQRMFAEDARYAGMVLEVCGPFIEQLAALGLMQSGPSLKLLQSYRPLVSEPTDATPRLTRELYDRTAAYLLERLGAGEAGEVMRFEEADEAVVAAMNTDFLGSRPRLVLMPELRADESEVARMRNVFANLGYVGVAIGSAFIAVRRDTLDEALERELRRLDG